MFARVSYPEWFMIQNGSTSDVTFTVVIQHYSKGDFNQRKRKEKWNRLCWCYARK